MVATYDARRYVGGANKDKGNQMTIIKIKADTASEASAIYCAKREASGLGSSDFPNGEWNGHHISYNGRVWEAGKEFPDAKAIYNPGGETPAIWAESTIK